MMEFGGVSWDFVGELVGAYYADSKSIPQLPSYIVSFSMEKSSNSSNLTTVHISEFQDNEFNNPIYEECPDFINDHDAFILWRELH